MATALKDVYSPEFYQIFSNSLKQVIRNFDESVFLNQIFTQDWPKKELKERMSHTAQVLRTILHPDYPKALMQIVEIIDLQKRQHGNGFNFEFMFFPDFIQQFGLDDYQHSIAGIEKITQYTSCEFVVRHFLLRYPEQMVAQMTAWADHEHHYVRRLASEGMRTRLPWAIGVPLLKKNPELILPILEKLINDDSDWVRKSVANSLNDLSKDFPQISLNFTKQWIGHNEAVNRALKHGARGLLKKGHSEMLSYFGIQSTVNIQSQWIGKRSDEVKIGDSFQFEFKITNLESKDVALRIEYRIYFLRGNQTHHAKTFKITEKQLAAKEALEIKKQHSFKLITTRKYHPGTHFISLVVNGMESEKQSFKLEI